MTGQMDAEKILRDAENRLREAKQLEERRFLPPIDRHKSAEPSRQFTVEYRANIESVGDYTVRRAGGVVAPTEEVVHYHLRGTLHLRPKDFARIQSAKDAGCSDALDSRVEVEITSGKPRGNSVEPKGDALAKFVLGDAELADYCDQYFPMMGMQGKVTIATTKPLPGDTPQSALANMVLDAVRDKNDLTRYSTAHMAFISALMPERFA